MTTERKCFLGELKATRADGSFEAVIATLNTVDSDGDVILPGAFGNATVAIVPAHNHGSVPLGKARMEDRGDFAVAVGRFNLDVQAGRDWLSALRFDIANGRSVQEWSFGFHVIDKEDGIRSGKRVRILKRLDVMEVSPVLRGAGVGTRTLAVKRLQHRLSSDPRIARLQQDCLDESIAAGEPAEMPTEAEVKAFFAREQAKDDSGIIITIPDPKKAAPFRYVYCRGEEHEAECAQRMAKAVASLLGIATPTVRFFRSVRPGESADYGCNENVDGLADYGEKSIYIRCQAERGVPLTDVVAHECRHIFQETNGWDMYNKAKIEGDAGAFGKQFALLPDNVELALGDGDPPAKFGDVGSLFGTHWLDRKSGTVYRADGHAPWPRWNWHGRLTLS